MKKIKILFVMGTHRENGNSEKIEWLVEKHPIRKKLEVQYVYLRKKNIQMCKSCYQCSRHGYCILDDDVSEIVNMLIASDIIFFVPVVYAFGTNSLFQMFLERAGYGYLRTKNRPLRDKIALVTVVGRRYSHEDVANQIIKNVLLNEMILVGSGFLPILVGNEFPGKIEKDLEGVESFNKMLSRAMDFIEKYKAEDMEEEQRYENIVNR